MYDVRREDLKFISFSLSLFYLQLNSIKVYVASYIVTESQVK